MELSKTGKQSMKCYDYMICVEKKGKEHHYTLEEDNKPLFRFMHRDSPGLLNPTSKIVQGMMKKMSGNARTKTEDGDVIEVPDTTITDKIMQCMTWLDELLIAYEDKKEDLKAEMLAEEQDKKLEELSTESEKFMEFLEENNATVLQYIWYVSEWLAGGEFLNIMTGVLCHLSTFFEIKAIWFMALGRANEGKTVIDEASLGLMPTSAVINGRKSEKALLRLGMELGFDFPNGKIMKMGDLGGPKDLEKWGPTLDRYKELATDGKTALEVVGEGIDEDTGERKILRLILEGKCAVALTSVNEIDDGQFLSRGVTVSPVATNRQVYWFFYYNQGKHAYLRDHIVNEEVKGFHAYVEYIKFIYGDAKVINPYWTCLEKWFSSSEFYKRALSMYPGIVQAVTLLNAPVRESTEIDGQLYIISTKGDNKTVADIFNPNTGLTEPAIRIFNMMLKWYKKFDPAELEEYQKGDLAIRSCDTIFTAGDIRNRSSKIKQLKGLQYGEILSSLVSNGLIEAVDKVKRGSNNIYRITRFDELKSTEINFDSEMISRYVGDLEGMYGMPPGHLSEKMDHESRVMDNSPVLSDLKLPPWSSLDPSVSRNVPDLPKSGGEVGVSIPQTSRNVPENDGIMVTNNDKSKVDIVNSATKRWGAFS